MKFKFSPHIALQVTGLEEAVQFYTDTLGMTLVQKTDSEVVLRCGPMTFHIEESPHEKSFQDATFFEFETDDLQEARRELIDGGCKLTPVKTPEEDDSYLVTDPYGLRFHVFQH